MGKSTVPTALSAASDIIYGRHAAIREEAIHIWASQNQGIQFTAETAARGVYRDIYNQNKVPPDVLGAFVIACIDLHQQGILKLERILQRKKSTIALYSVVEGVPDESKKV